MSVKRSSTVLTITAISLSPSPEHQSASPSDDVAFMLISQGAKLFFQLNDDAVMVTAAFLHELQEKFLMKNKRVCF